MSKVIHVNVATVQIMDKVFKEDMKLSIDELTHDAAYNLLSVFSDDCANRLGFECSEVAKDLAGTMENSDDEEISAGTNLVDAYAKE